VTQPLKVAVFVRSASEHGDDVVELRAQLRSAALFAHDAQRPLGVQALALLLQLPTTESFHLFHAANYAPLRSAQARRAVCVTVVIAPCQTILLQISLRYGFGVPQNCSAFQI
jgi:hypothetical protein